MRMRHSGVARTTVCRAGAAAGVRRAVYERLEPRLLYAADLTASFTTVPAAFLPGGRNKVVVRLTNSGDTAVSRATVGVNLFASTDAALDAGDLSVFNLSKRLSVKAAGGGANVNLSFSSPSNVPDGDYFLLAQIDAGNVVAENDETNNVAVTGSTVQIRQPFVDLTGTAEVAAGTFSIVAGRRPKAPKVTLAVTNSGNVAAAGTVTATLFASTDNAVGGGNDTQIGTVTKRLNARPGRATRLPAKLTLPSDLRTGDYNVVATFAFSGVLAETSLANNNAASSGKFTIDNPAFPPLPPGPTVSALAVDSSVLAVNTPEQLIFDVSITSIPAGDTVTAELTEVTADGTVVGKVADLLDNGLSTNSDAIAGDGIFSANTALQFTAPGDRFFRATIGGTTSSTTPAIKLTGVNPPSEAEVQATIDNANARQAQLTAAVGAGMTPSAAIQQTAANLATQPDVMPGSIQMGPTALAYLNFQGILTYLSAQQTATTPTSAFLSPEAAALAAQAGLGGPFGDDIGPLTHGPEHCADAIVLSPAQALFGASDPSLTIRDRLLSPEAIGLPVDSGFNVATALGADATVDAFKGLGRNRFISITAESFDVPGFGLGIKTAQPVTLASRIANLGDIVSNRLAVSGDGQYVLTNRFFRHYNGDMDGAIVLANVDNSTKDTSLADSFLRRGATAFFGFTGPASPDYRRAVANSVVNILTDPALTVDQALDTARQNGANDPFFTSTQITFFGTGEAKLEAGCDLLTDNDLVLTYSWNQNVRDLDTGTEFLGDSVGFSCGAGNEFMQFTGDNTSGGGSETVTIDLNAAFLAGRFSSNTTVTANAGWFASAGGSGPAVLTVALKNKNTGELSQTLTRTISPGTQSGCAATLVGVVTVNVTQDATPRVSITLA